MEVKCGVADWGVKREGECLVHLMGHISSTTNSPLDNCQRKPCAYGGGAKDDMVKVFDDVRWLVRAVAGKSVRCGA